MAPLLQLRGVSKAFGGAIALREIDFTLGAGEIHGLVGENGAGKSTLMKIIAGVHTSYGGVMELDGKPVHFSSPADALAAGIGMVHQELSAVRSLSIAENVYLGVQPINRFGLIDWPAMMSGARGLLDGLGIDVDPRASMGSISLGTQQLVELARVLFSGARIIILDEPTSALSPPETQRLFAVLRRLRDEGRSLIFISHFLDDVLEICDRVTVFRNGGKVSDADTADIDKPWLIRQMIGHSHGELEESYTGALYLDSKPDAAVILRAEALSLDAAFAEVSFEVRAGEVLGIYGYLGSGQLDLARSLFGKQPMKRGHVSIDGRLVTLTSTAKARAAGLAFVPESRRSMLFAEEPVYKNMTISILNRIGRLLLHPMAERSIAQGHIGSLHIRPPNTERPLSALSGGNQQKVALARWLTHLPRVLMLSEPTRGMDVGAKEDVVHIVRGLKAKGIGILIVSTEPETVLSMADRILVMKKGRVVHEFASEAISKDRLLAAA
jgi:ribose transport system ATP-binding protein